MIVVNPADLSTQWMLVLGGGALLCALLFSVKKSSPNGAKLRKIHSLGSTIPIVGDVLELLKHSDMRHDWMTAQSRRFNFEPWQMNIPGSPSMIVAADSKVLEAITTTHFDSFIKGSVSRSILEEVLGGGFANLDGEEWHAQRKVAAKFFSAKTLRLMMMHTMKRNMKQVSDMLDARIGKDEYVDLSLLFHQFTLQTFMEVGVGVDFPVIGKEKPVPLEEALGLALPIAAHRFILPVFVWKLQRWLNVGREKQLKEAVKTVRTIINDLVVKSLSKEPQVDANAETIRSAVELFVEHSNADQIGVRPEDLVDFVLTFVIAARDTSSLATAWIFYLLSQNPRVEARIREEFVARLPDLGVTPDDYVTADHVKQLVYFEATIKEALRLYPTASLVTRYCNADTIIDGDLFIRKGQEVTVSFFALARNPNIWGPDADEFKPERWISEATGELRTFSSTKFVTFSTGPRKCIGMNLAMLNLRIMIANLLYRYKFEYAENDGRYRNSLGLLLNTPVRVKVARA